MLLYFALLIATFISHAAAANKNSAAKFDKLWRAKKVECEQTVCLGQVIAESYNCVNKCTSAKCYEDIYEKYPLEDGEVDVRRSQEFSTCMRKEQREIA